MYDDLSLTFAKENQIHLRHTRGEGAKWNHMSDDNPSRYLMSSKRKVRSHKQRNYPSTAYL